MGCASPEELARGVWTASAGNMAQGVAWEARRRGLTCTVVVPDNAPATKLAAITRLSARIVKVPWERWWQVLVERSFPGMEGLFIHPTADAAVVAGNGTAGLEILEDLPDVDAILVPWGGGGLSCGIGSALRESNCAAKVFGCEVETAAPLAASLEAGRPISIDYRASFVDGIGARGVLPELWALACSLVSGSLVVSLAETAAAIRHLAARARIVAEGAGAAPVAAALSSRSPRGTSVCVVSGGNIDAAGLARILGGADA